MVTGPKKKHDSALYPTDPIFYYHFLKDKHCISQIPVQRNIHTCTCIG